MAKDEGTIPKKAKLEGTESKTLSSKQYLDQLVVPQLLPALMPSVLKGQRIPYNSWLTSC